MRAALLLLASLATPAWGQDVSGRIAAEGLRATETALAALPDPTPSERFALGGVRFLGGIERALQLRYRVGLTDGLAVMSGLPVLRLPVAENPSPEPFDPGMIDTLFEGIEADMANALEALSGIDAADAVAVEIATADLWFDIDADGARSPGEGVLEVAGWALSGGFAVEIPSSVTIRFDTADAAWLAAYSHFLAAISEGILALGPSEAVTRVIDARAAFGTLGPSPSSNDFAFEQQFADIVDLAAMFMMAIEGQPDPARTRAMRDHLLAMVQENRRFWALVSQEPDNDREWIPNKNQDSATGLPFPPETGPRWLAVLSDAEKVLTGELLIPFWRVGSGAGLDLHALLENPPELDLAGLIQGATLLPYLREGRQADARNLMLFNAMLRGDSALYVVMLN